MSLPDKSLDQGARLAHYRLMTAIAVDGKAAKIEQPVIDARHKRINLFSVATIMNVPVVLATYRDQNGMETFATHGLDLNNNLARFGVACNELCKGGVIVVPDTHAHPTPQGAVIKGKNVEKAPFLWTECRSIRPCENGHVIAEKGGEKAPSNHHAGAGKNRQNDSVRLTGHTARRNCGKRDEVLWDSELPGFGLRFRPPNGKSWIVRFRERKIARTISLGPVSEIDAEAARNKARKILAANQLDGLPTKAKNAAPKSETFSTYVDEFLEDYGRHWKPATLYRNKTVIRRELMPAFGHMQLIDMMRSDIIRWRDAMVSRSGVFNRTLPVLAVMLNYAEQLGYRRKGSNPCRGTPRYN